MVKKVRYMRELRKMVADILIKIDKPTKKSDLVFVNREGKKWFEQEDTEKLQKAVYRLFFDGYEKDLVQEYNIVDTFEDRTLGIAIKVKNIRRFSEKIEKRGWKVLNIVSYKNRGSDKELPLSVFTVRK